MNIATEDMPEDIDDDELLEEEDESGGASEYPNPDDPVVPPLTRDEIEFAFRRATHGFSGSNERWASRAATGMTDEELAEALRYEIGIFGGQGGPGMLGMSYQGNGLKIWADRSIGRTTRKPILSGAATIAMARALYGIRDPGDTQMSLL